MTEKLTRLKLPGAKHCNGIMDWGEVTAEKIIDDMRKRAAQLRAEADEVEAAIDSDFKIDIVRGVHVQHHIKSIQKGREQ